MGTRYETYHIRLQGGGVSSETKKPTGPASNKKVPYAKALACSEKSIRRNLIEFCCGEDSLLGQSTEMSDGCTVVRLTEKIDVTSQGGRQLVDVTIRNSLKDKTPFGIWASIPCTGGSPWQNINRCKPGGEERLARHRATFRRIWSAFEPAARKCCAGGDF